MKPPEGLRKETLVPGHQVGGMPSQIDEKDSSLGTVGTFIEKNFRHFNAATLHEAAEAYKNLLDRGGKGFLAMAGAMSTAEIGISLAEMIRRGKIHAISATAANVEEDLFNLIAHSKYLRLPSYSDLTPADDVLLGKKGLPRVTDTSIPEREAMKVVEEIISEYWEEADENGQSYFPHEFFYRCIKDEELEDHYEIDPKDSWMVAAAERNLPLYVFGWADSTMGNVFASKVFKGEIEDPHTVKGSIQYMVHLAHWYLANSHGEGIGFIELGGGIAADGPICVVPMLKEDLKMGDKVPYWAYYLQVCDAHTSYGGYSGADPNEKLSWMKLEPSTPRFSVQSDATIVAPLLFAYVLGY